MKKRLVLIGGGHAHMVTLARLHSFVAKGYEVIVIQPSEYHYYSGMGPGMLGGTYSADEIRFATRRVVELQKGSFILDKVIEIDPQKQVVRLDESGQEIGYDVLSCNAGSYVAKEMKGVAVAGGNVFTVKPIEGLLQARRKILELAGERVIDIAVVGGGPSAVEIAGNLQQLGKRSVDGRLNVRLYAGRSLMSRLPPGIRLRARKLLLAHGVEIIEGAYVVGFGEREVRLDNGESPGADIVFSATGVKPSAIFARSGLPTGPDGGLLVNRYLQSVSYPNIFGGGDCICFKPDPLDKVGVYAVRQNPVLYQNLMASLTGESLQAFDPGGSYLLIYNLGCETGIFYKWNIIFSGRLAFYVKDYIDRRFMRKFQTLEKDRG